MSKRRPKDLERSVQKTGNQHLELLGMKLERRNVAAFTNPSGQLVRCARKGQSDTYGWVIATGRHIELEWKRLGETPTPEQLAWLKECSAIGAIAFWADNVDTAVTVMKAVLAGGEIMWREDPYYDVWMPT